MAEMLVSRLETENVCNPIWVSQRASWSAMDPTPPAAAAMRTVRSAEYRPRGNRKLWKGISQAGNVVSGKAAASAKVRPPVCAP